MSTAWQVHIISMDSIYISGLAISAAMAILAFVRRHLLDVWLSYVTVSKLKDHIINKYEHCMPLIP